MPSDAWLRPTRERNFAPKGRSMRSLNLHTTDTNFNRNKETTWW